MRIKLYFIAFHSKVDRLEQAVERKKHIKHTLSAQWFSLVYCYGLSGQGSKNFVSEQLEYQARLKILVVAFNFNVRNNFGVGC